MSLLKQHAEKLLEKIGEEGDQPQELDAGVAEALAHASQHYAERPWWKRAYGSFVKCYGCQSIRLDYNQPHHLEPCPFNKHDLAIHSIEKLLQSREVT